MKGAGEYHARVIDKNEDWIERFKVFFYKNKSSWWRRPNRRSGGHLRDKKLA